MAETKIYTTDTLDKSFREAAMKRFGYGKGSISLAAEEAITQWLMKEDKIQHSLARMLESAKKDSEVVAIMLFGSYARRDAQYRDVDVAILIKSKDNAQVVLSRYLDMSDFIETRLFDISILNDLPADIQTRVFNEGTAIYMGDKELFYDYSANLIRRSADPISLYT